MTADEQAIRDLVSSWHAATAAGDVDTVLGLMDEDVVFLVAGHAPMRGRDGFAAGLRRLLATHRIESTGQVQEIAISGDLAYCWALLTAHIRPIAGGEGVTRGGSALSILRKRADGRWVVVRDANLLAPTG